MSAEELRPKKWPPPASNERKFLENLLTDECREVYAAMTKQQRTLVRFAFARGWIAGTFPEGEVG